MSGHLVSQPDHGHHRGMACTPASMTHSRNTNDTDDPTSKKAKRWYCPASSLPSEKLQRGSGLVASRERVRRQYRSRTLDSLRGRRPLRNLGCLWCKQLHQYIALSLHHSSNSSSYSGTTGFSGEPMSPINLAKHHASIIPSIILKSDPNRL